MSRVPNAFTSSVRAFSLLPSAAESSVELNQRKQLAEADLSQTQFSIKQVAVSIQGIEQCINAAAISQVGQALSVLQCVYK